MEFQKYLEIFTIHQMDITGTKKKWLEWRRNSLRANSLSADKEEEQEKDLVLVCVILKIMFIGHKEDTIVHLGGTIVSALTFKEKYRVFDSIWEKNFYYSPGKVWVDTALICIWKNWKWYVCIIYHIVDLNWRPKKNVIHKSKVM